MIQRFVPTEMIFEGVTYPEGVQEIPQELYDYIENDPQLSKVKPPKPVDRFAHLKGQNLTYLIWQLTEYEQSIAHLEKQFDINQAMGAMQPKQLVTTLQRVKAEHLELKQYLEPILKKKEAEEAARRERIVEQAKARGAEVTWSKDGSSWSEFYPTEVVTVGAKE